MLTGRATCDECRPKKRKQCAALVVSRAETLATLKVLLGQQPLNLVPLSVSLFLFLFLFNLHTS